MSDKFQNKYRIQSVRLQDWDYGCNACYFVTICTKDKEHYFGEIVIQTPNSGIPTMQLSPIGKIACDFWYEIPKHFPFVELDEFVVMPNHIHGIIIINKKLDGGNGRDAINRVSTENEQKLQGGITGNKNPMLYENLSRILRWYKGRTSFECRKIHADFAWQPRFYDHIIRNDESFTRIKEYIKNNPQKWDDDRFYE